MRLRCQGYCERSEKSRSCLTYTLKIVAALLCTLEEILQGSWRVSTHAARIAKCIDFCARLEVGPRRADRHPWKDSTVIQTRPSFDAR